WEPRGAVLQLQQPEGGGLVVEESIPVRGASALALTSRGDIWIAHFGVGMAQPPSLNRLIQQPGKVPSSGKWRIEPLELPGTPEGMRPTALAVVPASFTSDLVSLDDVLVCLGGAEGNSRPKIARYRQVEVDEDARALPLPLVVPV